MWTKSSNSEKVKPLDVEFSNGNVIVRKNFVLVESSEDMPSHYEYEEWQMTVSQYEVYRQLEPIINEQADALIELASLISEVL